MLQRGQIKPVQLPKHPKIIQVEHHEVIMPPIKVQIKPYPEISPIKGPVWFL